MTIDVWKLANSITAFSVAQSIAFGYAVAKESAMTYFTENPVIAGGSIGAAIIVFWAYMYALGKCDDWAQRRRDDLPLVDRLEQADPEESPEESDQKTGKLDDEIWNVTMRWRRIAISYFTLVQVAPLGLAMLQRGGA